MSKAQAAGSFAPGFHQPGVLSQDTTASAVSVNPPAPRQDSDNTPAPTPTPADRQQALDNLVNALSTQSDSPSNQEGSAIPYGGRAGRGTSRVLPTSARADNGEALPGMEETTEDDMNRIRLQQVELGEPGYRWYLNTGIQLEEGQVPRVAIVQGI